MKAIVYERYGPPDVLQVREVNKPTPRTDEILIRVRAAEATKSDCEIRRFKFAVKWFWLPLRLALGIRRPRRQILGGYFAGEVEAVGAAVTPFRPGDAVYGSAQLRLGAYGEYLCLPADYAIAPPPANLSFAEAAAVPLGGLNALHFMRRARLRSGETILINGAGGSIGLFAVQLAKTAGAKVTVVDHATKETVLRRAGADHFIDYMHEDFTARDARYDVIFNMVARNNYARSIRCLKPGGRYLTANPKFFEMIRSCITSRFTDKTAIFAFARETKDELLALSVLIEAGQLRPVVDRVYPRAEAAAAHHRVETEQRLGSVVIADT